jgi:hypothetical protein
MNDNLKGSYNEEMNAQKKVNICCQNGILADQTDGSYTSHREQE